MDALDGNAFHLGGGGDGGHGFSGFQRQTDFAVDLPGADVGVGVGVDAGLDAEAYGSLGALGKGKLIEQFQLGGVIHHNAAYPLLQRGGQLLHGLVVAVEIKAFGREPGRQGGVQFPDGNHVQAKALFGSQAAHGPAAKSLAGKGNGALAVVVLVDGADIAAAGAADLVFIHYIQRGTIGFGQFQGVAAADGQVPLLVYAQAIGYKHDVTPLPRSSLQ